MIVVSDTSPINYLILIDLIDVLPQLFTEVHAPLTVIQELSRLQTPPSVKAWAKSPPAWLRVSSPTTAIFTATHLDAGELAALALAKELNIPTILIDERKGRQVALKQGLFTMGTLAVLERAARKGIITLTPALSALQLTSFRISAALIKAAMDRDAQRKNP